MAMKVAMEVRELAALVAREADAGVAGALAALEASRVLVPETVTARVSSVPPGGADSLDEVVWQAEVVLRASSGAVVSAPGPGSPGPAPAEPAGPQGVLAGMPVTVLSGAGAAWGSTLAGAGFATVGELAVATAAQVAGLGARGAHALVLVGRARVATQPWPPLPPGAASWGSVLAVARRDPATLPGDRVLAYAVWALCVELLGAVDSGVLARVPLVPSP